MTGQLIYSYVVLLLTFMYIINFSNHEIWRTWVNNIEYLEHYIPIWPSIAEQKMQCNKLDAEIDLQEIAKKAGIPWPQFYFSHERKKIQEGEKLFAKQ